MYAPASFPDGTADMITSASPRKIHAAKESILHIFALEDFSSDDSAEMQADCQKEWVLPIGYATAIEMQGCVISARHIFNTYNAHDIVLYSPNTEEFYSFALIEDGALLHAQRRLDKAAADYVIGLLMEFDTIHPQYPPYLLLSNDIPATPIVATLIKPDVYQPASYTPPYDAYPLVANSPFGSTKGDCGLPWLDSEGNVFAVHIKRTDRPLFSYERTGLLVPALKGISPFLTAFFQTAQLPIPDSDYHFPHYTSALGLLGESDESGKRRDEALGETPTVKGWGTTVKNVLFRYFMEGKALLRTQQGDTTKDSLQKQFPAPQALAQQASILIDNNSYRPYWFVKVEGQLAFKPLIDGEEKNTTHMGHAVPAVYFWNEGCQPYLQKNPNCLSGDRKKHISETYKHPGMDFWIKEGRGKGTYIRKFMVDPLNYEFEGEGYNLSKSYEEKAGSGGFLEPTGYKWTQQKTATGRDEFKLVPIDSKLHTQPQGPTPTYRDLSALENKVTIKINGQFVNPSAIQWPEGPYKNHPKVKTDFVKNSLGDTFSILVTRKEDTLFELYKEKSQRTQSAYKFSETQQFFQIDYPEQHGNKIQRNRIFDKADEILDTMLKK